MSTKYTSKNLALFAAEQFNESFFEPEPTSIGYVFIGKNTNFEEEPQLDIISETHLTERMVWDNMYAAKKITGSDISLVISLKNWTGGSEYLQYDDAAGVYNSEQNFYVVNSSDRVYKCLSNNYGSLSTIEPTGIFTINNGISETADGYIWKYMYTIPPLSRYKSQGYMPIPRTATTSGYSMNVDSIVDGAIYAAVINYGGEEYTTSNIIPSSFTTGTNLITLATLDGVANGMSVTGNGIYSTGDGTYVVSTIGADQIQISNKTISSGGGSGNNLTFSTRAIIQGDGTGAKVSPIVSSSNVIEKIIVTEYGSGYSYANVVIYGAGYSADARAIIGPKYGHGRYPAEELGANSVMISVRIGAGDTTEGGKISSDTTFRQIGFLRDPYKYGSTVQLNSFTANNVVDQTYQVTLVSGNPYTLDEFVYQGTSVETATFQGIVNAQTDSLVKLTNVRGQFVVGLPLTGATSEISRSAIKINYPEFEPYIGDILYVENISAVTRVDGQSENIRFVINF